MKRIEIRVIIDEKDYGGTVHFSDMAELLNGNQKVKELSHLLLDRCFDEHSFVENIEPKNPFEAGDTVRCINEDEYATNLLELNGLYIVERCADPYSVFIKGKQFYCTKFELVQKAQKGSGI